jgi:hypothetical protein
MNCRLCANPLGNNDLNLCDECYTMCRVNENVLAHYQNLLISAKERLAKNMISPEWINEVRRYELCIIRYTNDLKVYLD